MVKIRLLVEALALFLVIPVLYGTGAIPVPIVPVLAVVGGYSVWKLLSDPSFDRRPLGWGGADRAAVLRTLAVAVPASLILLAAVWLFRPHRLFYLPRHLFGLWVIIMIAYPVLSVYPQELIYRAFFHHRYRALVPDDRARLWLGSLVFGLHHAVFGNWIAVALSLAGGFKFARTYTRSRSLLLASLEHAWYGCALFTIGLGDFFYDAALRSAAYAWPR